MSHVLNEFKQQSDAKYVTFDPTNASHLLAYSEIRYSGRQLNKYRFFLEHPYKDVVSMMQNRIVDQYLKNFVERQTMLDLTWVDDLNKDAI